MGVAKTLQVVFDSLKIKKSLANYVNAFTGIGSISSSNSVHKCNQIVEGMMRVHDTNRYLPITYFECQLVIRSNEFTI